MLIDLGTGDGRFVLHAARQDPASFAIGVDASRENLRAASRTAPANALFAIANVVMPGCELFSELRGRAARVTINFPWGSLRDALLTGDAILLDGLRTLMAPGAQIEVRLNASALAEAGWELHAGGEQVAEVLASAGLRVRSPQVLAAQHLRELPSSWSKRLAYGRSPEAVFIQGRLAEQFITAMTACAPAR
jgi:methylase of polypeptide subunit release factors